MKKNVLVVYVGESWDGESRNREIFGCVEVDKPKVLGITYFEYFAGGVRNKVWICFVGVVGYFNRFGIYEDEFVKSTVCGYVVGKVLAILVKYLSGVEG